MSPMAMTKTIPTAMMPTYDACRETLMTVLRGEEGVRHQHGQQDDQDDQRADDADLVDLADPAHQRSGIRLGAARP